MLAFAPACAVWGEGVETREVFVGGMGWRGYCGSPFFLEKKWWE